MTVNLSVNLGSKAGDVGCGDSVICNGEYVMVRRIVIHPPTDGKRPGPIIGRMFAVEVQTANGSRWAGGDKAWIGPDLRAYWERD